MVSAFEDRERNYEAKWAHDEDLRFRATARRNRLLGLWAAERMGMTGAAAVSYAGSLLDLEVRGGRDEDIARKVREDLASHHVEMSDHAIHRKMDELAALAADQLMHESKG